MHLIILYNIIQLLLQNFQPLFPLLVHLFVQLFQLDSEPFFISLLLLFKLSHDLLALVVFFIQSHFHELLHNLIIPSFNFFKSLRVIIWVLFLLEHIHLIGIVEVISVIKLNIVGVVTSRIIR